MSFSVWIMIVCFTVSVTLINGVKIYHKFIRFSLTWWWLTWLRLALLSCFALIIMIITLLYLTLLHSEYNENEMYLCMMRLLWWCCPGSWWIFSSSEIHVHECSVSCALFTNAKVYFSKSFISQMMNDELFQRDEVKFIFSSLDFDLLLDLTSIYYEAESN